MSTTAYERTSQELLRRTLAAPLSEVVAATGTLLLEWDDIAWARVRDPSRFRIGAIEVRLRSGKRRRLHLDGLPTVVGSPLQVLAEQLGDRFEPTH